MTSPSVSHGPDQPCGGWTVRVRVCYVRRGQIVFLSVMAGVDQEGAARGWAIEPALSSGHVAKKGLRPEAATSQPRVRSRRPTKPERRLEPF